MHTRTGKLFRFTIASTETQEIALNTPAQNGDDLALNGTTLLVANSQLDTLNTGRQILPFTITSIPIPP